MKTNQLFERLWEHGRTLRRVGLVLVMCLMAIPQVWGYSMEIYFCPEDLWGEYWDESTKYCQLNLNKRCNGNDAWETYSMTKTAWTKDGKAIWKGNPTNLCNDGAQQIQFLRKLKSDNYQEWSNQVYDGWMMYNSTNTFYYGSWQALSKDQVVNGGYVYFDNSATQWSNTYKYLVIGHNSYSRVYQLTQISNTNLWYVYLDDKANHVWEDATYCAFIGSNSSWSDGDWGPGNVSTASKYTATFPVNYSNSILSGKFYLYRPVSSSDGTELNRDRYDAYGGLNWDITFKAKIKAFGEDSYAEGTSKGKVTVKRYTYGNATSCGSSASTDVLAVGGTSGIYAMGYVSTRCTLTVANVVDGYTFRGWYADGSRLSETSPYRTYSPKATTVYAYFEANSYTITYNNMDGATNHPSNPSSYGVTSSTITLQAPTKSGYVFAGWCSDEGCTTRVSSIPSGSTGNKVFYAKWLSAHEPGKYVTATGSGGYGKTLTDVSGIGYERYLFGISSSKVYVGAADKVTSKGSACVLSYATATGNFDSGGEWLSGTAIGNNGSGSQDFAGTEFASCGSVYGLKYKTEGQGLLLRVKGYSEFAIVAKDNDDSKSKNKYLQVLIDGSDVTDDLSTEKTVRRYSLTAGTAYTIQVKSLSSSENQFWGFSLKPGTPTITVHPSTSSASYDVGDAATALSVTATKLVSSGTTLSYQWYSNTTASNSGGTIIDGATSASYTPPTTSAGTTYYYCVVSETGCNSATSNVSGAITVTASCTTPTIAWSTSPANGNVGGNMTISVTSNYPAGVTISSNNSNATLTGRTVAGSTVSYTLNYAVAGGANITASVTGAGDYCAETVELSPVAITISKNTPTSYTASGGTFCSGAGVVTLSGSQSGIYYQLYNGASTVGDAKEGTGSALTWTSLSTAAGYTVKTVANDTYSAATMSGTATVAFYDAVSIGTQPTASVNATVSSAASLSGLALASGTYNSAAYRWQTCNGDGSSASDITSGSAYANYTTSTLSFTPSSAGTYYFRCKVTDGCGTTVYSNVVTVTAKNQPAQYPVSGTASICSGDDTDITLSDSEDGVTYKLYKGGVDQSDDKVGDGDELTWTVSAAGTYTVKAEESSTYWERAMSGSATVSFKTATSISTQPATAVDATVNEDFTLGSALVAAGDGTLQYQWFSYSNAAGTDDETSVRSASTTKTYTTSKAATGTYYYRVKVIGGCGTVASNVIAVTVAACSPATLVKTVITGYESSAFQQTTTGSYAGTSIIDLTSKTYQMADLDSDGNNEIGYKMDDGKKFYVQLSETTLQAGDIIKVGITKKNDNYSDPASASDKQNVLIICAWNGSVEGDSIGKITGVTGAGFYTYTVKASDLTRCEGSNDTIHYVGLARNRWGQNPYMHSLEIIRPCAVTTYSVTVEVNDEDYGSASAEDDELEEDGTTEITATPNTGYEFTSWAVSGTGAALSSTTDNPTTLTMGTADATVTATFTAINYTLTWDLAGGTVTTAGTGAAVDATGTPSSSVAYGSSITAPEVEKDGYDFSSWSPSVASKMPAANTTYTAQWAERFTVSYDAMGGSVDPTSATGSTASKVTLPTPTHDDYTFDGWYTSAGTKIGDGGEKYGPTAAITLYAKWKGDCDGGDGVSVRFLSTNKNDAGNAFADMSTSSNTTQMVGSGAAKLIAVGSASLSATTNKDGYRSDSRMEMVFYFSSTSTLDVYVGVNSTGRSYGLYSFTPADGDHDELSEIVASDYATCSIVTSNVSAAGAAFEHTGTGTPSLSSGITSFTQIGGAKISYTSLSGFYVFKANGTSDAFVYGFDINGGSTCYTVTYHGNGSTSGYTNDPAQHTAGSDVTVMYNDPTTGFKRTGYEFNGWNTKADASGTRYDYWDIDHRTIEDIAADVDLYAEWRIVIDADNTDFAGKDSPTQYKDVKVTNGATLTITNATTIRDIIVTDDATLKLRKSTTAHDVTVETGSTLNINTTNGDGTGDGITLTANSLSLQGGFNELKSKYDMPRVYINPKCTLTRTDPTINFDISVNHRNYYPIALPFDVALNNVDYADSYLASISTYGMHYEIDKYNGQKRANSGGGAGNWETVTSGETLKAGMGYIMSAITDGGKAIIRFPMNVPNGWTTAGEQGTYDAVTKNEVAVYAYTKAEGETKKANKGWNLLGVPYMSCFVSSEMDADPSDAYIKGLLNIWSGEYKDGDNNIYVTIPKYDFTEYDQLNITEAVLLPGWCFFVQMDEDATITFDKAGERARAPFRATNSNQAKPTVKTGIILSGAEASDKTTILVSDKYNAAEYEINADLEKMFGENGYTLATYSLSGETRLAYNAMSNADAENIIPIGYRAPAEGEYTFLINPRYAENGAFESVNLIDYETGIVTDLLMSSYTFSTDRTQNDARFALNVVKQKETPTGIENGANGANDANGVRKLLLDGKMYIILDGKMFDAQGKRVK